MLSIVVAKPNNITNEGLALHNHRLAIAKFNAPGSNSHFQINAFTLLFRGLDLLTILDLARLLLSYMSDRRIWFLFDCPGIASGERANMILTPDTTRTVSFVLATSAWLTAMLLVFALAKRF